MVQPAELTGPLPPVGNGKRLHRGYQLARPGRGLSGRAVLVPVRRGASAGEVVAYAAARLGIPESHLSGIVPQVLAAGRCPGSKEQDDVPAHVRTLVWNAPGGQQDPAAAGGSSAGASGREGGVPGNKETIRSWSSGGNSTDRLRALRGAFGVQQQGGGQVSLGELSPDDWHAVPWEECWDAVAPLDPRAAVDEMQERAVLRASIEHMRPRNAKDNKGKGGKQGPSAAGSGKEEK